MQHHGQCSCSFYHTWYLSLSLSYRFAYLSVGMLEYDRINTIYNVPAPAPPYLSVSIISYHIISYLCSWLIIRLCNTTPNGGGSLNSLDFETPRLYLCILSCVLIAPSLLPVVNSNNWYCTMVLYHGNVPWYRIIGAG